MFIYMILMWAIQNVKFIPFLCYCPDKQEFKVKQKQQELYLNYTSTFVSHSHKIDPDKFYRKTVVRAFARKV